MHTDISDRVEKLTTAGRTYFDSVIQEGRDNPTKTLAEIRKGLTDGSIEIEFRPAAQMAIVALTESSRGIPTQKQPTEEQVRATHKEKIARAEELGLDNQAARLREVLERVDAKEAQQQERANKVRAEHQKQNNEAREAALAQFDEMYDEMKAASITEMTHVGRMTPENAEAFFQQFQHQRLSESLRRQLGL